MSEESKATLSAVRSGCAITLLGACLGATIGYMMMPAILEGGYYGAIADVIGLLFLYCGGGCVVGLFAGAIIAGRVARRIGSKPNDPNAGHGKDLT